MGKIELTVENKFQKDDEPKYLDEGDKVNFLFKGQMLTGEVVMRSGMHYAICVDDFIYTMERPAVSFIKHKDSEVLNDNLQ